MTYWFKRRRYGLGYTPVTWQGWLAVAVMVVLAGFPAFLLTSDRNLLVTFVYVLWVLLLVAAFVGLAILKGPRMKWRWGKSPSDDPSKDF